MRASSHTASFSNVTPHHHRQVRGYEVLIDNPFAMVNSPSHRIYLNASDDNNVHCVVAVRGRQFRILSSSTLTNRQGTYSALDAVTDLSIQPELHGEGLLIHGGSYHSGVLLFEKFKDVLLHLAKEVKCTISVSGHSLGGAGT